MYRFSVDLINGVNSTEKLANTPINKASLNTSMDILINCLEGNFVQALNIQHYPDEQIQLIDLSESATQEHLASPIDQQEINNDEFRILCNAIKKSINLNTIRLLLTLSLTEYQEKELVAVLSKNPSITLVKIDGCISPSTINTMQAIIKQRSELEIVIDGVITSTNNIPEAIKHNQEKIPGLSNMHLIQGFIAAMGAAALATAFVLLHAATLNPLGIIIAAAGGASLTYSAYSFFASGSSEPPKNRTPNNSIPAM